MPERAPRTLLVLALAGVWLALTGVGCPGRCGLSCGSSPFDDAPSGPWPTRAPGVEALPKSARTFVVFRTFRDAVDALSFGATHVPDTLPGRAMAEAWRRLVKPDGGEAATAGIAASQPALVFELDGCAGATFRLSETGGLRERLQALGNSDSVAVRPASQEDEGRWEVETDGGARLAVVVDGTSVAAAGCADASTPPLEWFVHRNDRARDEAPADRPPPWLATDPVARWLEDAADTGSQAVGLAAPGRWLNAIDATGQARKLYRRAARHAGPLGVRLQWRAPERTVDLTVEHLGDAGEPSVLGELGAAKGRLPPLGGLIEPGVLGVLRLSVQPRAVYRLLRSTLPAPRRRQLDAFWKQLERKAMLEGPGALLDLWTGHAIVVAYGIESDALQADGADLARRLLSFQATREAILLPITRRAPLERTLNVVTQLSHGQLSRQTVRDSVQYAWLSDNILRGALILGDEHLIVVDSAASVDRATAYEKRGRPLGEERQKMGLGALLENPAESGLFVDVGTLANLLSENGYEQSAAWLMPFQSVVLTTSTEGDEGRTKIELKVDRP